MWDIIMRLRRSCGPVRAARRPLLRGSAGLAAALLLALALGAERGSGTREVGALPDNPQPTAVPGALDQAAIERLALERARGVGLRGTPTAITARRMTLDEARRRMGQAVYEPRDPATPVWLVVIRGAVWITRQPPPADQGDVQPPQFDHLYLLLDTAGHISSFGAKTDSRSPAVDLDAPVPAGPAPYWSTPITIPPEQRPRPVPGPVDPEPKPRPGQP